MFFGSVRETKKIGLPITRDTFPSNQIQNNFTPTEPEHIISLETVAVALVTLNEAVIEMTKKKT